MKDRFTTATEELVERNPYLCESCSTTFGHPIIGHLDSSSEEDQRREAGSPTRGFDTDVQGAECLFNCDPMPFGD